MDSCEAAQSSVSRLTSNECTARLELIKAKGEVRQVNVSFECLKVAFTLSGPRELPAAFPTSQQMPISDPFQTSGLYPSHQTQERPSCVRLFHG